MSTNLFKKGDVVVIFHEDRPDDVVETEIVAVTAKMFGTPKVRIKGARTFDWSADGREVESWSSRRLVTREDLPAALAAARLRLAKRALAHEFVALFERVARDARSSIGGFGHRSEPEFDRIVAVTDKLRADLELLLEKFQALGAEKVGGGE